MARPRRGRGALLAAAGAVGAALGAGEGCEQYFGADVRAPGLRVTVLDADGEPGYPWGDTPYVHYASPTGSCRPPRPSVGCHRYFTWYYSRDCAALGPAAPNISLGVGAAAGFDASTGVLSSCAQHAVDVVERCYGPPADAPLSCQCPGRVPPPPPPEELGAGSESDEGDASRVIFTDTVAADLVGLFLFPSIAAVATTAGVGGGGIFVPLLIIMGGFNAKAAAGVSQALIFGACCAALLTNVSRHHPTAGKGGGVGRPLIDFEMALMLSPMEMAGALVGVIVNIMLPTWLLQALMFTVLFYTAYKTFTKGWEKYKTERAALAHAAGRGGAEAPAPPSPRSAGCEDVEADVQLLRSALDGGSFFVDIRAAEERAEHGAIIAAQHVEMERVLTGGLPDVDKEAEIIVVGQMGGERAQRVKAQLQQTGYRNVKVLKGGIDSWNKKMPPSWCSKPFPPDALIDVRQLARRTLLGLQPPYALDVRTAEEVDADKADPELRGTLPENAIPAEEIVRSDEHRRLPDCERSRMVLLVGVGHMQRCARVYEELRKEQFTDVRVLDGGLKAWRALLLGDRSASPASPRAWKVSKATSLPVSSSSWGAAQRPTPRDPRAAGPSEAPAAAPPPQLVGFSCYARPPRTNEQILQDESAQHPTRTYLVLLFVWVFLIFLILAKGGKKTDSALGIESCSGMYWLVWLFSLFFLIAVSAHYAVQATVTCEEKRAVGFHFLPTDLRWTPKMSFGCAVATFGAGVIAGVMGIGGGMVLGPLMLQLGVDGRVSSATTATMIALTSSSAVIAFFVAGIVPWSYALVYGVACFAGAFVGKRKLDAIVKRRNLTALIVLLLAAIIGAASLFVLVLGAIHWHDLRVKGELPGFASPC